MDEEEAEEQRLKRLLDTMGPEHESIGETYFALGECLLRNDKLVDAETAFRAAQTVYENAKPYQPCFVGVSLARISAIKVGVCQCVTGTGLG
jgi:hypothetical protein